MSKPLIMFLELLGGGLLMYGLSGSIKPAMISIGLVIMLIGGYGIRKRLKRER